MSNKAKGSRVERELVELFTKKGWRAVRVAGSGVKDESPCDLLAAKPGRKGHVVEVKSSRKSNIYISKEQINDFVTFAYTIGLAPVLAVKFNYEGWLFLAPEQLKDAGKNWVINLKRAKQEGKRFGQFFEASSGLIAED